MDSLIVNPKNEKELKLVTEFLDKLGVNNTVITDEQKEHFELSFLMEEGQGVGEAPREAVYKSFKSSEEEEYEIPEEFYKVLDERRARHLAGESASCSWQEVKAAAKKLSK
jgi:hypothetical protein